MNQRFLFAGVVVAAILGAAALLAPRFASPLPPPEPPEDPSDAPPVDAAPPAPIASAASSARAAAPLPPYVRPIEGAGEACGEGMLLVDGVSCPFVGHLCSAQRAGAQDVCEEYGADVFCEGRLVHRRFCIDRDEYPNLEGALPAVLVDFDEAARACGVEGKRLCAAEEWEFACEGAAMWPYPTGRVRDARACNIDGAPLDASVVAEVLATPARLSSEITALDGRVASGAKPACISAFGVRDLAGNVAEWVVNVAGKQHGAPFRSAVKGGSWSSPRTACRAVDVSHEASHRALDLGFRCCKDARGTPRAAEPAHAPRAPKRSRMREGPG